MLAQVGAKKIIGLGSNMEPRRENIKKALKALGDFCNIIKVSSVYETAALLTEVAEESWNQPYLNMAVEIEFEGAPMAFLEHLKKIESSLGRAGDPRWAPRPIDLDILFWGQTRLETDVLSIPHQSLEQRSFVLDPLKDLVPSLAPYARKLRGHLPQIMSIVNLTADSFSQDGLLYKKDELEQKIQALEKAGVHILDLGAESTAPGAHRVSEQEEMKRLSPVLRMVKVCKEQNLLFPKVSLDTQNFRTAEWALQYGVDIINDVSGLHDEEMLSFLGENDVDYVLTHSLGAPVVSGVNIKGDAVDVLKEWLEQKLTLFEKFQISFERIYFDPGIGFGKTPSQCLEILRRIEEFYEYPVRILVGHSRKRFMKSFSPMESAKRDDETLGVSMNLVSKGVVVLRVHNAELHLKALRGWCHVAG